MPLSPERNPNPNPIPKPLKRRNNSLPDLWFKEQSALKHAILKMRLQSLSNSTTPPSEPDETLSVENDPNLDVDPSEPDYTKLLSDELLSIVLSKLPESHHISNSLVCKRWSRLSGRLVFSLKLLDWEFLESGRLGYRFPNLTNIDTVRACVRSSRNSGISITHKLISIHIDSSFTNGVFIQNQDSLDSETIDRGIRLLVQGCPNLRKLVLIGVRDDTLTCLSEECEMLQELEIHRCTDLALKGITGCQNLQILKLIASIDGFYNSVVSDIGLTILAQGCKRLVKLELVGCEGSYDGIKAIGQCCQMLEELTLCDHRMDGGWLAALSYCGNLKTLKLQSCKSIDPNPGLDEHLGSCPTLEELHLQRCHIRNKQGAKSLFQVCETVRDLVFEDCWGLDNNIFVTASMCRRVRFLSLEGCSLLTVEGLDAVVLSWKDLKRLKVVSCNNIKDSEITPALATLFSVLKELKWRPDSRSLLSSGLAGTGVGQRGGRSLKWK